MSARKPTLKERLFAAEREASYERARAEKLWAVAAGIVAHAKAGEGYPEHKLVGVGRMEALEEVLAETVECSCGRRASCWAGIGGGGPKMCETCMSS